ncbi:MAG: DUF2892 domain-containing protein [Methanosarcinaceae archaeon]|nr:DUF2892 domain-containing protein [Methanosarcinaceae archaeon]
MDLKELLFKENVGGIDLYFRALLGSLAITALAAGIMRKSRLKWILALIGFTGIFTSLTRHCTPYTLLGINTAKDDTCSITEKTEREDE